MSKTGTPVYSREFKLAAVRRMLEGVNVSALSRELQVTRKRLYAWRDSFQGQRGRNRVRVNIGIMSFTGARLITNIHSDPLSSTPFLPQYFLVSMISVISFHFM
jgi:hypothetical protein